LAFIQRDFERQRQEEKWHLSYLFSRVLLRRKEVNICAQYRSKELGFCSGRFYIFKKAQILINEFL